MADASDSKSDEGDFVWVQVPSPAYKKPRNIGVFYFHVAFRVAFCTDLNHKCYSTDRSHNNVYLGLNNLILTISLDSRIKFRIHNIEVLCIQMFLCNS